MSGDIRKRAVNRTRNPATANPKGPRNVADKVTNISKAILIASGLAVVVYVTYLYGFSKPSLPNKLPAIADTLDKRKWGTYRAHTYFGLRTRDPRSPLFGVMWYEQPDEPFKPNIRHWCRQEDGLSRYAWVSADGRTFGRQNLTEKVAAMRFDWLNYEDTWTARISTKGLTGRRFSFIFYMIAQDSDTKFHFDDSLISSVGTQWNGLGVAISTPQKHDVLRSTLVYDGRIPLDHLDDLMLQNMAVLETDKGIVFQFHGREQPNSGNLIAVQFNVPAESSFEISMRSKGHAALTGPLFEDELKKREKNFNKKFSDTFHLEGKNYTQASLDMGKVALSNMLGGIGYWFGYNKVAVGNDVVSYGPHSLFSSVPSRPFFPRGFLWDEGFHNILISRFDPDLSVDILTSWLNTMNEKGWMPREMILGVESEAKVPSEYIVQRMDVANPPSLLYVFDRLVQNEKVLHKHGEILSKMYPKLEKWYTWLLSSQRGKGDTMFRWRGRNSTTDRELNPKTLASGLDDYPRASHPSAQEYHLDLRCWMAVFSRVMSRLSKLYGDEKVHQKYAKDANRFSDYQDIVRLHWSNATKAFSDYGSHSKKVEFKKFPTQDPGQFIIKRVTSSPELGLVDDIFGYNSIFPLMMHLIPADAPELKSILDKISDPGDLWTDFGLRSLSKKSRYYAARNTEHDPPYWRGYIWINMNYLVISALEHYSSVEGPNRELAKTIFLALKKNLVRNMSKQFNRTGYLWENYDDRTGEGRGCHPFTGWSALILSIMSDHA